MEFDDEGEEDLLRDLHRLQRDGDPVGADRDVRLQVLPDVALEGLRRGQQGHGPVPRKIDGRYAMIGRQDNENLYLIYSDDLYTWEGGVAILKPRFPWEFVQIGNCGSPIELDRDGFC